jgi:hypothetical protein
MATNAELVGSLFDEEERARRTAANRAAVDTAFAAEAKPAAQPPVSRNRQLVDSLFGEAEAAKPEEPRSSGLTTALATGARIAFPTVGSILTAGTPAGGIIGAGVGETVGEIIELAGGQRKSLSPGVIASEAALGAIPFGRLARYAGATGRLAKTAAGAAEGAGFGLASLTSRKLIEEGELPSAKEAALTAGGGALLGGAIGRLGTKSAPRARAAKEAAEEAAVPGRKLGGEPPVDVVGDDIAARAAASAAPEDTAGQVLTASLQTWRKLVQVAKENPDDFVGLIKQTEAYKEGLRRNRQFGELVTRENLGDGPIQEFIRQNRLGLEQAASHMGLGMNQLSQLSKVLTDSMEEGLGSFARRPSIIRELDSTRRAAMTAQFSTMVRNVISQAGRYSIEVVDQGLAAAIKGEKPHGAKTLLGNILQPAAALKRADDVLDEFVFEAGRLRGRLSDEVSGTLTTKTGEAVRKAAQLFNLGLNDFQEMFFRRMSFDAALRSSLQREGVDVAAALANPKLIPEAAVKSAVDKALEMTFSRSLGQFGKAGQGVQKILESGWGPVIHSVTPFPRFMANSLKFVLDYNPAGVVNLLRREGNDFLAANPEKTAEVLSKAAIGTAMMAGGLAFRSSRFAGPRWYQLNVGAGEDGQWRTGDDQVIDIRSYSPLASSFSFLAEAARQMSETGSLENISPVDMAEGLFSIQRVAGTLRKVMNATFGSDFESIGRFVQEFAGEYAGGFSVPLRTLQDVLAQGDESLRVLRDPRADPLTGPFRQNIPYAAQDLPPRRSPYTGDPIVNEAPLVKQVTGLGFRTMDPVEAEAARLGIGGATVYPRRTRIPEVDTEIMRRSGAMAEEHIRPLLQSRFYMELPPDEKAALLREVFSDTKKAGRGEALAELPYETYLEIEAAKPRLGIAGARKKKELERELAKERSRRSGSG